AHETFGHLHFEELDDAGCDFVDRIDLESDLHAPHAGEGVDEDWGGITLGLLEKQRGAAGFYRAVGELCDFQDRVDFEWDTFELIVLLEGFDEVAQVVVGHRQNYYDDSLTNRIAFITGASRGIGRACAISLAGVGHSVILAARNQELLTKTAETIRASGGQAD